MGAARRSKPFGLRSGSKDTIPRNDTPPSISIRWKGECLMKALSIRQPWAWLIVYGAKTVEN